MDDKDKPISEFEKIAQNESSDIQIVDDGNNESTKPKNEKKDLNENDSEQNNEVNDESNDNVKIGDIQIIDDGSKIDLPQTKDSANSSIPKNVESSLSDVETIGTIKPDKQKSPIAMLVLFGVLIIFILFMPTAISLFNQYFGTNLSIDSFKNNETTESKEEEEKTQEIKMYSLNKDTTISLDKLEFGGFTKDNTNGYKLSFYIKNTGAVLYKFEKKLYLEYYDDNNTFVGRSYLESIKEITGGITNNYTIIVDGNVYNNATKIEIIQRTEDDYPNVTLTNKQLTCTNENDNLIYTFDDGSRLTNIRDMYTYTKGEDLLFYNNDLLTYKTRISNLDLLDGVTAVLTETDTGFITSVAIDYQYADYSKLSSNTNYYIKDTYAKVISFEMNAKGYTCR